MKLEADPMTYIVNARLKTVGLGNFGFFALLEGEAVMSIAELKEEVKAGHRKEYQAKYRAGPKGKAAQARAQARYRKTEGRKAAQRKYQASAKGKAQIARANARYRMTSKGKESDRRFKASAKGQVCLARYNAKKNTPYRIRARIKHSEKRKVPRLPVPRGFPDQVTPSVEALLEDFNKWAIEAGYSEAYSKKMRKLIRGGSKRGKHELS